MSRAYNNKAFSPTGDFDCIILGESPAHEVVEQMISHDLEEQALEHEITEERFTHPVRLVVEHTITEDSLTHNIIAEE